MIVIATTVPKVQKWLEDAFLQYAPPGSYCLTDSEQAQFATTQSHGFPIWIIWRSYLNKTDSFHGRWR